MSKQDVLLFDGIVIDVLPNTLFRVKLNPNKSNEFIVLCHISGKIRQNKINIIQGDEVEVEISPYDLTKGRITYRKK